jgi:hypothetical protein
LVEYDTSSEKLKTFEAVVPRQSVISLVNAGNLLVGGTSIFGGLGVQPQETEAKLFGWDPLTSKKVFEMVPLPGAMAITGLMQGPDGHIWGVADGTLFVLDLAKRQVIHQLVLYKIKGRPSHIWRNAFLLVHPSGQVYGNINNQLFRIDPKTMKRTVLLQDVSLLTMDEQGALYFRRSANLWRYEP